VGVQPDPPQVGVKERFVTESGSVYTVDHDEKTMTRTPGAGAGEVAHDNEPITYETLLMSPDKSYLAIIWTNADGRQKLRQTTRVLSSERWVE
jgi:hypothetical protein